MALITPMVYLALMTWAIIKSNRRWMTFLWIVASLAVSVNLFAGAAQTWLDLTEMFGHMALIPSLLVSALVGINLMQSHAITSATIGWERHRLKSSSGSPGLFCGHGQMWHKFRRSRAQ